MQRLLSLIISLSFILITHAHNGILFPSERFSSGLINDICQDKYGYIWIATDYGLNKFDGYRFTTYIRNASDTTTISSNTIARIMCDRNGDLWIGTRNGLDRFDYAKEEFIHYKFPNGWVPRVNAIIHSKDNKIIAGTSGYGTFIIDQEKHVAVSTNKYIEREEYKFIKRMVEDSHGRIWTYYYSNTFTMKNDKGVKEFTSTKGEVTDFVERDNEILIICKYGIMSYRNGKLTNSNIDISEFDASRGTLRIAMEDKSGDIYIGTIGEGLFKIKKNKNILERVEYTIRGLDLNTTTVKSITEDSQGNIWFGCPSKGLVVIMKKQPQFNGWNFTEQRVFVSSTVSSICEGDNNVTWCSVQDNGIYGFNEQGRIIASPTAPPSTKIIYRDSKKRYWIGTNDGLYSYNPLTGDYQLQFKYSCDNFKCMSDDKNGNLYISVYSKGMCSFNPQTKEIKHYSNLNKDSKKGGLCNDWITAMKRDHLGYIWIATNFGISCYDPSKDSFKPYGWDNLLEGVLCHSINETRNGLILIGTDQGLYSYKRGDKEAKPFTDNETLRNKVISYIFEDKNGDIWCSTSMGIWQYDIKNKKFIGHVIGNGLTKKEYINNVGLLNSQGIAFFGNNSGLTMFTPVNVKNEYLSLPNVKLTGFFIAGEPISSKTLSNGKQVIDCSVIDAKNFNVSYLDNTISLEFSSFDYHNPGNIIFEYKINNGHWIQNTEGQNSIQLSQLQPSTYTIDVRALAAGTYSAISTFTVNVIPPWYQTSIAYILYCIIIIAGIILGIYFFNQSKKKQLDEEKMKFLINATHDIRSPLTLIIGPLNKLKESVTDDTGKGYIDIIDRNAQRLMILVSQILDERKIDKKQMQLRCKKTDLVNFINGIYTLYQTEANMRNINFTFEHKAKHVEGWIDRINFDKVMSNLLSNAFKHTPDGSEINIVLESDEQNFEISVIDNGIGIKEENPERLFKRFYQGNSSIDSGIRGTGIGLNLSRSIVLLHGGKIKASNRNDGKTGACFTVTIPLGNKHLKADQIIKEDIANNSLLSNNESKHSTPSFSILIADDDYEIAEYINTELGTKYKFNHVPNGKEALKELLTHKYDLFISDIMMPEMDGLTLLKRIKTNPTISEIPVILLTSKAEITEKLKGLKFGADAYIGKPFDIEELNIQIDNLINNILRLKGKFSGALQQKERVENIVVKGNNDAFMERVMNSINSNLQNSDFNVDALAEELCISRAQLHRKIKELTGVSTGKFLRNLRMEQAARLLKEGKVNISQIAYLVGFNDQTHFSTVFKNYFGVSPSEYAKSHKN